ncbi:unnamed protein product [Durusdinium trenchii]|uniref:EF-hand domain-containing protein n=1 Tax=Durusdinium trenchii TaxID=1381693 RepID=A0ABP0NHA1_9DINO
MDFGLVSLSLIEELAALLAAASFLDVSALRMLRMMRLVRVARIIRMLRFFSELRVMVNGIMGSAKPLLWAFVFLLILMFMVGVTFMQLAANYMSQDGLMEDDLMYYWGSLARTMMTLYMAISGGVDWKDCVAPLHVVSWAMEYMFATYVFFTLFCCLNIVTGIFVDNAKALKSADEDAMYLEALTERKRWIAEVKELFSRLDTSINGKFTFQDFKTHVSSIKVQTLFRKLGINVDNIEADELWEILDADRSGEIDEEEFAKGAADPSSVVVVKSSPGLKYFQGPAQSIHVYRLMKENQRLHDKARPNDPERGEPPSRRPDPKGVPTWIDRTGVPFDTAAPPGLDLQTGCDVGLARQVKSEMLGLSEGTCSSKQLSHVIATDKASILTIIHWAQVLG